MSINKIKYELEEVRSKNEILINLLNKLITFDKKRIFLYPVNVELVPDYLNVIKQPMDFTTMKQNIQNFKYNDFEEFEKDFYLIINNCYTYNDKNTIYHRIAENLENYYKKISIKMHKKYMNVHSIYHKDKNTINNISYNANANNLRKIHLKEKKKNEKTRKYGKVGRPCKLNTDSKSSYMNNLNEYINISDKKKKINNKYLSNGDEEIFNNFKNNTAMSSVPNFVNNIYENGKITLLNLENMIEKEDFNAIIDKLRDSHDKSNDIFYLLIEMLSSNKKNYPILCNYVNINKSLRKIFFEDNIFPKSKMNDYSLIGCSDNNVKTSNLKRKIEICDTHNYLNDKNKKYKLLNETQYNNYEHIDSIENRDENYMDDKNITEDGNIYTHNNNDTNLKKSHNKISDENFNCLSNDNDNLYKNKYLKDSNDKTADYYVKKNSFLDEKSKLVEETITCNIGQEELTMNLLNYKESVKKFIGESNFPTFIKIFPNIYSILDNTDVKDIYYSAFNDLRIFGLDTEDFTEFNNKIIYNENYLLGIGKYHINNIFTLDKNLSNILNDEQNNSQIYDKLKIYLSNDKLYKENRFLYYYKDNNKCEIINDNNNDNHFNLYNEKKKKDESIYKSKNENKDIINNNYEIMDSVKSSNYYINDNDIVVNKQAIYEEEKNKKIISEQCYNQNVNRKNFVSNEKKFECEWSICGGNGISHESSSDDENLNLKNFFFTYNSYLNKFYEEKKKKKIFNKYKSNKNIL